MEHLKFINSNLLPTITINKKDLNNKYRQIGDGGEGIVYRFNDELVFKTYEIFPEKKELINKFMKIQLLGQLKDDSFCFPLGLIRYKWNGTAGYYSKYIKTKPGYPNFDSLKYILKKERVLKYLIEGDTCIKRAHAIGITIGDVRGSNILIDSNDSVKFIDTDNYSYKGFYYDLVDVRTKWLSDTFKGDFSMHDSDIYLYTLLALQSLVPYTVINLNQNKKYFDKLIEYLNVDGEVKDGLRIILSDSKNKPYIGPLLSLVDPSKEIISEEHCKKLNLIY